MISAQLVSVRDDLDLTVWAAEGPGRQHTRNLLELSQDDVVQKLLETRPVVTVAPHRELDERDVLPVDVNDSWDRLVRSRARQFVGHHVEQVLDLLLLFLEIDIVAEIDDDLGVTRLGDSKNVLNPPGDLEALLEGARDVALHVLGGHAGKLGHDPDVRRRDLRDHTLRNGEERIDAQPHHDER